MGREHHRTSDILEAVALLVIDMQESFLRVIPESDEVVRRCAFAVEAAHAFGIRVVFTEQVPEKLGGTHQLLQQLAGDARVYSKNTFSALQSPGLIDYFRKAGIYHLLIAGLETPVCVYQTALHAQDSDFDVTVLSDCVTGRRSADGEIVLRALAGASCHILPAETVFYSMLGNSGHRLFPALTALVKKYSVAASAPLPEPSGWTPPPPPPPTTADETEPVETADEAGPPDEQASAVADDTVEGAPVAKKKRRRRGGARRRRARERAVAPVTDGESHDENVDEVTVGDDPPSADEPPEDEPERDSTAL